MLIIEHRCNSIERLLSASKANGCEVDLRNHGDSLIVAHDPFDDTGPNFSDWLNSFDHEFLIVNVKEEGLEIKIFEELRKHGVVNFFILDETFPYIRKWALAGVANFALRVSEFEHYKTALLLASDLAKVNKKISWIWVDTFSGQTLSSIGYQQLKEAGFKLCFVSPELHESNKHIDWRKQIRSYKALIADAQILPDAVCTKLPDLW